jgi:hypothetical protein
MRKQFITFGLGIVAFVALLVFTAATPPDRHPLHVNSAYELVNGSSFWPANKTTASNYWSTTFAPSNSLFLLTGRVGDLETITSTFGDIITTDIADYATAAQGAKADTAIQGIIVTGNGTGTTNDRTVTINITGGGGGTSWPPTNHGAVLRSVRFIYTNKTSTAAVIPLDQSLPQISEGQGTFTNSYTPISANSNSHIRVMVRARLSAVNVGVAGALFEVGNNDALDASFDVGLTDRFTPSLVTAEVVNSNNTTRSFCYNFGGNAGNTIYINRLNNSGLTNVFSTAVHTEMIIEEIQQ